MKEATQIAPNFGAVYAAALYPDLARIFIDNGYALAVHGSLSRDFDLIAVPWVGTPSEPQTVIDAILAEFAIRVIGEPTPREHNRLVYALSVGFGNCAIDLSFMPTL